MKRIIAIAALALCALVASPVAAVAADDPDNVDITVTVPDGDGRAKLENAQLQWGINRESTSGAFAGGCNFLSAGTAGSTGSARAWAESDNNFKATEGNVSVIKPTMSGTWEQVTWANKCKDATGANVTTASTTQHTGAMVSISGGTGEVWPDGSVEIKWKGSFTVAYYGGMSYWSATDPVLSLDKNGNGQLRADLSGYQASMDDLVGGGTSQLKYVQSDAVVLATIRGADLAAGNGFAVVPEYVDVTYPGTAQSPKSAENAAYWGSFPESFVAFQRLTEQAAYWYTSGGTRDIAKPATTLYVNYDAEAPAVTPVIPPESTGAGGTGATPSNPVRDRPASSGAAASTTKKGTSKASSAAVAAESAVIPAVAPITTIPGAAALVPELSKALSPLVMPLGLSALSLLIAIISVLNLMGALPWQRRSGT